MSKDLSKAFTDALHQAEETRQVGPLIDMFSEGSSLSGLGNTQEHRGKEGAREFWQRYLDTFTSIRSQFTHEQTANGGASLEWTSRGELANGTPITYSGVSLLEFDGEKVSRFRTYYDTAAFLPQGSKHAAEQSAVGK